MRETSLHIGFCGWLGAITVLLSGVKDAYADLSDGLVAYYPFNGNANDESGNGNHLVNVDAVASPDRRGAPGGGSYAFNGVTSKLVSTGYKGVTGSAARTISLWMKPSGNEEGYFFSYGTPTWEVSDRGKDFRLRLNASNTGVGLDTNWVGSEGDFPQPLAADEWHHLVVTVEQGASLSDVKWYLDGALLSSWWTETKSPRSLNTSASVDVTLGGEDDRGIYRSLSCEMDDVRIYNRALAAEEALALYQHEKLFSPFLTMRPSRYWITMHVTIGRRYQLETSMDMTAWEALGEPFTAVSKIAEIEEKIESARKFYRIVELPR